ncbi:DUF1700 domain-containing protein [Terricaulis silvestris]|uniref:Putative membrane protein n=1 Tax=Terricaulis silvestris TaxID=2686094 RepID=A0A6I6MN37_9CAUL|nr:DUF1700 domain-containing protein [Terricaulis silvestris]QGZ96730.1 putative membrane protein [Terricaulis silvestris]
MTDRVSDYLAAFERESRGFGLNEASDIANDVRSHINEAVEYGKPLEEVLTSLGTPKALARAYAVELLMGKPKETSNIARFVQLLALVAFGGLLTLIVVTFLGSIGLSFVLSGILLFVLGLLEAGGVHLPHVQTGGMSPWLVAALGPVMFAIGWGALVLLRSYVRFAGRQLVRALPRRA